MPKTVRLSKTEENELYKKCIEVNKVLIGNSKMPVKESELMHFILEESIRNVKVNKSGELYIDI